MVTIGTVTIWDLLTTSWLLKGSHDRCDNGMHEILRVMLLMAHGYHNYGWIT